MTQVKSPVVQQDDYYPFGLTFNSYSRENSLANNFKFTGKEQQNDLSLNWFDFGARMYDPAIGRWPTMDKKAELYFNWSPYTYALNTPINAIDPDGHLVIFINGNFFSGEGGDASYWRSYENVKVGETWKTGSHGEDYAQPIYEKRETGSFDNAVMNQVGDHHAMYVDGSHGGWVPFNGALSPTSRSVDGYQAGKKSAKAIIESLAKSNGVITESIKIITHSLGSAYGKGYAKALLEYAKKNKIQGVTIAFIADFAAFQSGKLNAVKGPNVGPTLQFSHGDDAVAGNDPQNGAEQKDTSSDPNQGHAIMDFMNQVSQLPTGSYKVVDGKIVPDDKKK